MIQRLSRYPRNRQPELMDQPDLPDGIHRNALIGLARLNRMTGIAGSMYRQLVRCALHSGRNTLRVLDVASGSADLPIAWAKRAKLSGLRLEMSTLEISGFAIEQQLRHANRANVSLNPIQQDCLNGNLPGGFDVITNSLFLHHLDEADTTRLLQKLVAAAGQRVVVCDLERSRLNLGLVIAGAQLVSRSHVVHHDAIRSVQGAYTLQEFRYLATRAIDAPVAARRILPCRFMATLPASKACQPGLN
ncbi:methyltransferase domain-containing protein [Stieleria sp. TO1_6]|uniref:methyltransferase domain-containing protein n=1 Tax=Stieleria tagensis TaxID=2956795 RepID=UPI00209ADBFF|nr:methyltransferase domain-containing protein [Stieleria tagensis]MCO8123796.1 methyltransferase domain-containing protein [Stieleria tagensis]